MKKIAIAMSGGVDSGVAAALLVKGGYQCTAFHMHLWSEKVKDRRFVNKCCSTESLEAARKTAHQLGMPFHVIDFSQIFKKKVVDYFLEAYGNGLTPNPCIFCNKFIKFGELLNYVRKLGFAYLVTGHYARITEGVSNAFFAHECAKFKSSPVKLEKVPKFAQKDYLHLLTGKDKSKDQSYFLYNLTQDQLAHILFPVGDYQKKEVVALAKKWQLPVAHRPESQEICFLPENDYRPFLKRHIAQKIIPGEVVNIQGKTIGRHQGLPLYTIGQRHGFDVDRQDQTPLLPPYYVIGKNIKKNQLIVGFGKETERKEFLVKNLNWLNPNYQSLITDCQLLVRIRHQGELLKCKISLMVRTIEPKYVKVVLDEPERGIAPGQSAVFYSLITNHQSLVTDTDYEVLGGGIIADYPLTKEKKND